ncbi:unnamed protein product [Allacma fusca]|uniref:Uncharacterized protein n=1 Tax=Allacma fusca TaxID=39272 RepID=A0A8J2L5K5_9HEXA|nr:unnamed protein product [Allacma fusca]
MILIYQVTLILLIVCVAVATLSNIAGAWPIGSLNAVGPMADIFVDPDAVANYRESRAWSPWTSADSPRYGRVGR